MRLADRLSRVKSGDAGVLRPLAATVAKLRGLQSPAARRGILLLAVTLLVGGIWLSLRHQPGMLATLDWRPALIVLLIAVPLMVLVNTYEFYLSGRLIGYRLSFKRALEVTVIGTAANLLPIPGSTLVRISALKVAGARLSDSAQVTLLVAAIWIAIAFLFAGIWLFIFGEFRVASVFTAIGVAAAGASFVWAVRLGGKLAVVVKVTLTKSVMVALDAFRIWLCLKALGMEASYAQGAALSVAGVVGSAVSIVPAGLGVREAVSAGLGPLVGISAAVGFLSATLNRLLGLVMVVPFALGLVFLSRWKDEQRDVT